MGAGSAQGRPREPKRTNNCTFLVFFGSPFGSIFIKKHIKKLIGIFLDFWTSFGPILEPKIKPKIGKDGRAGHAKICTAPRREHNFELWAVGEGHQKHIQKPDLILKTFLVPFGMHFGTILRPKGGPKTYPKNDMVQKRARGKSLSVRGPGRRQGLASEALARGTLDLSFWSLSCILKRAKRTYRVLAVLTTLRDYRPAPGPKDLASQRIEA